MKEIKWEAVLQRLKKYRAVLLVLLVGMVLLAWPEGEKKETASSGTAASAQADLFQTAQLEEKLAQTLSQVEGAGEVKVVLTLRDGPRQVLAQDGSASEGESQTTRETTTLLRSAGTGVEETVTLQELGPTYQGALVVAQGGDDPQVRLALSGAVSALTGLGTDKISICKGK
jgi:stage III sporulation protein AG